MVIRTGKKLNFKRIYSQIAKYGKSIPELAKEYGVTEEELTEKMKMGLGPKLFSNSLKISEKNIKQQKNNNENGVVKTALKVVSETTNVKHEEEKMEPPERQKQSNKSNVTQRQKKQASRNQALSAENVSNLENKKVIITGEISDKEKALDEATKILAIREQTVTETQRVFNEASQALSESKRALDKARNVVEHQTKAIEKLKTALVNIQTQITELKNKAIYLVAPGFTGEKPAFGTYYSSTKVDGFETLSVVEVAGEYAIEPELKDMVVAGYDSYKEYMEGLRFVMLCAEYTYKGIDYTVLVNDERLKKLLQEHIG